MSSAMEFVIPVGPLLVNICLTVIASCILFNIIPKFKDMFIAAGLSGIDMNKLSHSGPGPGTTSEKEKQATNSPQSQNDSKPTSSAPGKPVLPEAQGVLCGAVYLIVVFLFIPVPFYKHLAEKDAQFPHYEFVDYLAALLSMCCMLFLGFTDDVLNLKWRHKLWLPTMASLPLLMVYFINFNHTTIVIPRPFQELFGATMNLSFLYYIYMGMMAVFCTNAINILAGVNGLEAGQTLVIAISVVTFNVYQLLFGMHKAEAHVFSLYLLIPYIGVTIPLFYYNWCPAQVFVGDTFCYFSGMVFAVVSILGHFSKTMLLFFLPQIVNFLYSVPQLFRFLHCPRHRLPRVNPETGLLGMSTTKVKESDLNKLGQLVIKMLEPLGLLYVKRTEEKDDKYIEYNNMTIINLAIKFLGPIEEGKLTSVLLFVQVLASLLAFTIRLHVSTYFYDD